MESAYEQQSGNEEVWRAIFAVGHPDLKKMHGLYRLLPNRPRCRLCKAPFGGIGGWIMRRRGKAPNSRNPYYCNACDKFLQAFPGGADVDMSLLYVDIRQSTEYAESHRAAEVSQRVNRFLSRAAAVVTEEDGFVLAFYGDCIVASWAPGFCGPEHARKALGAARRLISGGTLGGGDGESIPVGVGVHTGEIYIGTVAAMEGTFRDVSVFGSNVNLTARMAALAAPAQIRASAGLLRTAGENPERYPCERVELKGFGEPVEVYTIG